MMHNRGLKPTAKFGLSLTRQFGAAEPRWRKLGGNRDFQHSLLFIPKPGLVSRFDHTQVSTRYLEGAKDITGEILSSHELDKAAVSHYPVNFSRHGGKDDRVAAFVGFLRNLFEDVYSACVDRRDVPHSKNEDLRLFCNKADRLLKLAHSPEKK